MVENKIFKGFRIATYGDYSGKTEDAKAGFLWFIKRDGETDGYGDIYFGSKHYGHNGNEATLIAYLSGVVATLESEIGSGFTESSVTEVVTAIREKFNDYYTSAETDTKIATAKSEAIESAATYVDAKLGDYAKSADTVNAIAAAKSEAIESAATFASAYTDGKLEQYYTSAETDTKISEAINALDVTDEAVTGKIVKAVSEEDGKISVSRDFLADTDIKLEKIATPDSGFSAQYKLVNGNGVTLGTTIDIAKDQFLQDAKLYKTLEDVPEAKRQYIASGTQFPIIMFTFITLTEDEHVVVVSVKDLVDTYNAGQGIAIDSANTISVRVAESESALTITNKGKNFLEVDENELRVNGVDADAMVIAKNITIEGGEWAEDVKKVYTDGTLPAGETFQDFMQKMLCVEKWGSPTGPTYSFTASIGKPSITASKSGKVPVGTKVTFSAAAGSMSKANSASVAGYTYGYSLDGTSKASTATSYSATVSAPTESGNIVLSCSTNAYLSEVDSSVIGVSGASKEYYVLKGAGIYTANSTGKTVTRGSVTDQDVYNVSNLTNVRDTDKKSITDAGFIAATSASITPSAGNSASVEGYYPVYYGSSTVVDGDLTGKEPSEVFTEAFIKALANKDKEDVPSTSTKIATAGGSVYGGYCVAVPTGNSAYSKAKLNMKSTSDSSPMGSSNNFTTTINMYNDVETVSYKVFYIANAAKDPNAGEWYMSFE